MAFCDQGRRRFEIAVDEDVALRRDDEVGGEVFAADIVEISGDAERWKWLVHEAGTSAARCKLKMTKMNAETMREGYGESLVLR